MSCAHDRGSESILGRASSDHRPHDLGSMIALPACLRRAQADNVRRRRSRSELGAA